MSDDEPTSLPDDDAAAREADTPARSAAVEASAPEPIDEDAPKPRASRRSEPPPRRSESPPRRSEPPPRPDREEGRKRLEGLLRDALRKAVEKGLEAGVGTISRADSAIRGVVDDVKLPREIVGYVFSQIDETKNALVRVVAGEVREFLDATDIAAELQRVLTSLSFEIKTEIRFIPNEAGGVRPKVKAKVAPRRTRQSGEDEPSS